MVYVGSAYTEDCYEESERNRNTGGDINCCLICEDDGAKCACEDYGCKACTWYTFFCEDHPDEEHELEDDGTYIMGRCEKARLICSEKNINRAQYRKKLLTELMERIDKERECPFKMAFIMGRPCVYPGECPIQGPARYPFHCNELSEQDYDGMLVLYSMIRPWAKPNCDATHDETRNATRSLKGKPSARERRVMIRRIDSYHKLREGRLW